MIFRRFMSSLWLSLIAGCGSSPTINYFSLQGPPPSIQREAGDRKHSLSVQLAPVSVPELVDRPQLVLRLNDNRLEISDTNRWGEPLKQQISRTLAEQLAQVPGLGPVIQVGQDGAGEPDVRVTLDILDIEAVRGSAVSMRASWVVRRKEGGPPRLEQAAVREPVGDDRVETLVAAHGKALKRIGQGIARSILALAD